MSKGLVIP